MRFILHLGNDYSWIINVQNLLNFAWTFFSITVE